MSYRARQTPACDRAMVIDFAEPLAVPTGLSIPTGRVGAWSDMDPEASWDIWTDKARAANDSQHAHTHIEHIPGHASVEPDAEATPVARTSLYVGETTQRAEMLGLGLAPDLVRSLFVREYSDTEPYRPGQHDGHLRTHVGQDKLLVCEVMCVALQMLRYRKANPSIDPQRLLEHTVVLCLGSASGNPHQSHFHKLVALFPDVHWVMYDPNPMGGIGDDESGNVHVYQYAFGELDMNWWVQFVRENPGVNLIMLSDVRSDVYVEHLKMRRATMWRLLTSMRDLQRKLNMTPTGSGEAKMTLFQMQKLEEVLMAAIEEEQEAATQNACRIRADNRWQNLVLTAVDVSAGLLKYVTEWQGSEERARMGHQTEDRILRGALWYQPAAAPSSTELRHSIVRKLQPVYSLTDRGGRSYVAMPVGKRMPKYTQGLRFSSLGPRGQHYGPNLEAIVDTCATDEEHRFADLLDTVVVDEVQIEKQCFCANKYVKNQADIVNVSRTVLSHFQTIFGLPHTPLQLHVVRTVGRADDEEPPRRHRRNSRNSNLRKSTPRHNADEFHSIQTEVGCFLEMYWQWRAQHPHMPYAIHEFRQFMDTAPYKHFATTLKNVTQSRYHFGAADVFPEMRSMWGAGEPIWGYTLSRYVEALRDAIEDPKSYSNGPSHEPVSPLYSIPCTAECLHLLAVSEKMIVNMSDEARLTLYTDELNVSSIDDPARRWVLKHALAQLTAYNYGDALPIVGPSLKSALDSVKSRLRRIMALPEFGPDHAYLSRNNGIDRYAYTDPGCWSYLHEDHCTDSLFLFNPYWQIMVYNVMLPRLLDEAHEDTHGKIDVELERARGHNIQRFVTGMKPYQVQHTNIDNTIETSLLYNFHLWPKRSPLVFNVAAHPSDSAYILDVVCQNLEKRNIAVYEMVRSKDKCMLLHVAASSGNYDTVQYLLGVYHARQQSHERGDKRGDKRVAVYWDDMRNKTNGRTRNNTPCNTGVGETPRDVVENRLYGLVTRPEIEARGLAAHEIGHLEQRLSKVDKLMVDWSVQNNPHAKDTMTRDKIEKMLQEFAANHSTDALTKEGIDVHDYMSKATRLLTLLADDGPGGWQKVGKR